MVVILIAKSHIFHLIYHVTCYSRLHWNYGNYIVTTQKFRNVYYFIKSEQLYVKYEQNHQNVLLYIHILIILILFSKITFKNTLISDSKIDINNTRVISLVTHSLEISFL